MPPQPHYILTSGGGGPPTRCWSPRGHPGEDSGCRGTAGGDRGGGGPGVGLAGGGGAGDCAPPRLSLAWEERGGWSMAQEPPWPWCPHPLAITTCCPPPGGLGPAPGTSPLPLRRAWPRGAHAAGAEPPATRGSLCSCCGITAEGYLKIERGTWGHHSVSSPPPPTGLGGFTMPLGDRGALTAPI